MSQATVLTLKAVESFGDVVFWLMMLPAILKYNIFGRLPAWVLVPMLSGGLVSGLAGIALYFMK